MRLEKRAGPPFRLPVEIGVPEKIEIIKRARRGNGGLGGKSGSLEVTYGAEPKRTCPSIVGPLMKQSRASVIVGSTSSEVSTPVVSGGKGASRSCSRAMLTNTIGVCGQSLPR